MRKISRESQANSKSKATTDERGFALTAQDLTAASAIPRPFVGLRELFARQIPVRRHYAALPDSLDERRPISLYPAAAERPELRRAPLLVCPSPVTGRYKSTRTEEGFFT